MNRREHLDEQLLTLMLPDEAATMAFGARLLWACLGYGLMTLSGPLGAGKTTLVRGLLRETGYQGPVKSPTFTLVESYESPERSIYHFDLYRLADPEELEWMGFRDYLRPEALCLIEWPQKGEGFLPSPDLEITLTPCPEGRRLQLSASTLNGDKMLERLRGVGP